MLIIFWVNAAGMPRTFMAGCVKAADRVVYLYNLQKAAIVRNGKVIKSWR